MIFCDLDDDVLMQGRAPTHNVYAEDTNSDGSDRRRKIGVGYSHPDGGGVSLIVDCVPLSGAICVRARRFKKRNLN